MSKRPPAPSPNKSSIASPPPDEKVDFRYMDVRRPKIPQFMEGHFGFGGPVIIQSQPERRHRGVLTGVGITVAALAVAVGIVEYKKIGTEAGLIPEDCLAASVKISGKKVIDFCLTKDSLLLETQTDAATGQQTNTITIVPDVRLDHGELSDIGASEAMQQSLPATPLEIAKFYKAQGAPDAIKTDCAGLVTMVKENPDEWANKAAGDATTVSADDVRAATAFRVGSLEDPEHNGKYVLQILNC